MRVFGSEYFFRIFKFNGRGDFKETLLGDTAILKQNMAVGNIGLFFRIEPQAGSRSPMAARSEPKESN